MPTINKHIEIKKELVKLGYSKKNIIEKYSKIGLWLSEHYLISKYFNQNNTPIDEINVLDIGCGCGRTTIPLKLQGYDVTGIDISPDMLERAKQISQEHKLNIDFTVMDATNLTFPDEYFDNALFSYNGIEHIPTFQQKIKVLEEVYRVLKIGGHFIFTVHSGIPLPSTILPYIVRKLDTNKYIKQSQHIDKVEIGERFFNRYVPESTYAQIVPIFYWWKWLKKVGLDIAYTNTRRRVNRLKESSYFSTLFYSFENFIVCKKPNNQE
jgi:ubiquinone/menaquinone biosynthesis C-methylase UbiE